MTELFVIPRPLPPVPRTREEMQRQREEARRRAELLTPPITDRPYDWQRDGL
jgi:hypothetical protein